MRILVTGAAGFIGSHLVRHLLVRGDDVLALVRPRSDLRRLADLEGRLSLVPALLEDRDELARTLDVFAPEAVVHAAWYVQPADYLESPANLASLEATLALLQLAVEARCPRFVGVGTCLEYAELPRPRREDDPCSPRSLYASAKLAAFHLGRSLSRGTATRFAWARIFHPYGPAQDPSRVLPRVAAALRTSQPIELSSCQQQRDPVRVEDVASALALLASATAEGAFNVCTGAGVSLRGLLEQVARVLGGGELLLFGCCPDRPGEPACLIGDPARLHALGWRPAYPTLSEGLAYLR